jgi:hypothetical protein
MRHSRLARSTVRTPRRRTTWATTATNAISLTAANQYLTTDLLATFKAAGGVTQGCTIARTILRLTVLGAPAAGDQFVHGIIRGQTTDVGANVAGAPTPLDFYEDWAWLDQRTAGGASSTTYSDTGASNQIFLDLKVGRKIPEIHQCWNYVILAQPHAAFPTTFNLFARTLLYLP